MTVCPPAAKDVPERATVLTSRGLPERTDRRSGRAAAAEPILGAIPRAVGNTPARRQSVLLRRRGRRLLTQRRGAADMQRT